MSMKFLFLGFSFLFSILYISLFQPYSLIGPKQGKLAAFSKTMASNAPAKKLSLVRSDVAWFSRGSAIEHLYGGGVQISAPQNWGYIGRDKRTAIVRMLSGKSSIKLICHCTEKSSCESYIYNSEHYCNMKNSCGECKKEATIKGGDDSRDREIEFEVSKGGFIKLDTGVRFEAMSQTLPMAFAEMFEYPLVRQAIQTFLKNAGLKKLMDYQYSTYSKGEACRYFALNIFGRRAIIVIPNSMLKNGVSAMIGKSELASSDKACVCSCTEGNCDLKNYLSIIYCENSSCLGACTLKNKDESNHFLKAMQSKFYRY